MRLKLPVVLFATMPFVWGCRGQLGEAGIESTDTSRSDGDPIAAMSFSPSSPQPGDTVTVDASDSYDTNGAIIAYAWDFGDGKTGTGKTATGTYATAGKYQVKLTVTDDEGNTDSVTKTITVSDTDSQIGTPAEIPEHAYDPDPSLLFAPPRGLYDDTVELTLSTDIADGVIRYTLDGSPPNEENGTAYGSPVQISTTSTVRAVVLAGGVTKTLVQTHTYVFPSDVIRQGDERPTGNYVFWTTEMDPTVVDDPAYSSMIVGALRSIPTMSIVTDHEKLFGVSGIHRGNNLMEGSGDREGDEPHPDWVDEVTISLEMFYPADYPRQTYGGFQVDAGLKTQGGGGRWYNGEYDHKQSFGLRFRTAYGFPSLKYPVFEDAPLNGDSEVGKYDKLILRAGHNKSWGATWDNEHSAYTRDQLGRDLQIQMSGIGVRGAFVHLYLNGLYWGLYNLTERGDDAHSANYLGGDEAEYYCGKAKGGDVDGDNTRFNHWQREVAGGSDFSELESYLAVDKYIDMAIINVYAATGDFPQYYFGNRAGAEPGPIYFYNWDLEDSFGGDSLRSSDTPTAGLLGKIHGFKDIWANYPEFRDRFAQRVDLAIAAGGTLADENVLNSWNTLNGYIEAAMVCESARWGDERIDDTGERYTRDEHWSNARDLVSAGISGKAQRLLNELKENEMSGHPFYPSEG